MDERAGPDFYDDAGVFETYQRRRQRPDSPNATIERPAVLELVGDPAGRRALDLGCGDAALGADLLRRGAASYLGVEGSARMAELARQTLAGTAGRVLCQPIEAWSAPPESFDLALACLSLHYVEDLAPVLAAVARALAPDGQLVISVEHPVITSCARGWPAGTLRQDWVVDDYFAAGERVTDWMGGRVRKYHRTVEDYFRLVRGAGLLVEDLCEARPRRELFPEQATYERRMRIPLFLILSARRPQ